MASRPDPASSSMWRTFAVLGRVSNLPTVWSNSLAAWLLAGGTGWTRLAILCGGTSMLYLGGMFLNDAFDAKFDARFRPERPIPSGHTPVRRVFILGTAMLGTGVVLVTFLGWQAGLWAGLLALGIVVYDATHKKTALAPILMGSCRFLLYMTAASVATTGITRPVLILAAALGVYVVGISCLARHESSGTTVRREGVVLLLGPVVAVLWVRGGVQTVSQGVLLALLAGWALWCVAPLLARRPNALAHSIPGLLAGIVLVDLLAIQHLGTISIVFALLFAGTLILQKLVPAT